LPEEADMLPIMTERLTPLDTVDEIYTDPTPSVDFVKMQIGFWEKLVVLDAATLAASFTASGIFHEHLTGDGGVGYLAAAWKLLFCGLALCLLAQWIAIPGAIAISGHYYGMRVLSLLNRSVAEVTARGGRPAPEHLALSSEIVAQSPKLRSRAKAYSRFAGALGSAGLLTSIAAFYWLYRFAHVNVYNLGH
jgi:hypothetical protein